MPESARMVSRRMALRSLPVAALLAATAAAADPPPSAVPFVMTTDAEDMRIFGYFRRVYAEALRRLGYALEVAEYSLQRRAALADSGAVDGEMGRVRAYGDAHPLLVRVEEPVFDFSFALFTARSDLRIARIEDLAGSRWLVEYRRGILMCEETLAKLVPRERLSDVATPEQGVRKLLGGRTDLYCDIGEYDVDAALLRPEFRGSTSVRRVLSFATLPIYPYLAERHRALAPRLAEVLRQMRAEGLLDRLLREETQGRPSGAVDPPETTPRR